MMTMRVKEGLQVLEESWKCNKTGGRTRGRVGALTLQFSHSLCLQPYYLLKLTCLTKLIGQTEVHRWEMLLESSVWPSWSFQPATMISQTNDDDVFVVWISLWLYGNCMYQYLTSANCWPTFSLTTNFWGNRFRTFRKVCELFEKFEKFAKTLAKSSSLYCPSIAFSIAQRGNFLRNFSRTFRKTFRTFRELFANFSRTFRELFRSCTPTFCQLFWATFSENSYFWNISSQANISRKNKFSKQNLTF